MTTLDKKPRLPLTISVVVLGAAAGCGSPKPDAPCKPGCQAAQDADGGLYIAPDGGVICFC
jgi:hypothetical protein